MGENRFKFVFREFDFEKDSLLSSSIHEQCRLYFISEHFYEPFVFINVNSYNQMMENRKDRHRSFRFSKTYLCSLKVMLSKRIFLYSSLTSLSSSSNSSSIIVTSSQWITTSCYVYILLRQKTMEKSFVSCSCFGL